MAALFHYNLSIHPQVTSGIGDASDILERAKQRQINLRKFDEKTVSK